MIITIIQVMIMTTTTTIKDLSTRTKAKGLRV